MNKTADVVFGSLGVVLAAGAVRWFLAPPPLASDSRHWLVALQLIFGVVLIGWVVTAATRR